MKRSAKALLAVALGCVTTSAQAADTETIAIKPGPNAARVVTCAVSFPVDSVKFPEDQVERCMGSVDIENVSYIHVIATADATGSSRHNLYLSTRRAGAIEAFLTNRFPEIPIHAFGGGVNPKFGKLARIFIVEHQLGEEKPVQVASIGTPEIIERTKTEFVTKIEYRDSPKTNVYVATLGGVSATTLSDDVYNYVALEAGKIFSVPTIGSLGFGLRHRLLQSDEALDLNSTSAFVHRPFVLSRLAAGEVYYDQSVELGRLLANGYALEWGATAQLGYRNKDYQVALTATKSNLLTSLGAGLGIRL